MQTEKKILTTHVGSLPRPLVLLDAMKDKLSGGTDNSDKYDKYVADAVADIVQKQVSCGIDIITDGEMSKPGFFSYVNERIAGFEARPDVKPTLWEAEVEAFPEYYEDYFKRAMLGGNVAPICPLFCTGPISYIGENALKTDLENLRQALTGVNYAAAFLPSISPSGVGTNEFYATEEEYFYAVGDALRTEYLAIVDAGFQLQIDDPFLCDIYAEKNLDEGQKRKRADMYVEAVNYSLRDIPEENIRYHTCYGINEGPRVYEASLYDVVDHMLKVNAYAYSFEAANCRHEHEYHLWESVKLQEGKVILPGVITHGNNIVEHPELIAERLLRFANLVGSGNVIASADCGFSSQACYKTEVDPKVMWAKFQAMVEGAGIASKKLWG